MLSPLFILVPIGLAVFGGALIIPLNFRSDRMRNIYAETVAILTSASVWIALAFCSRETAIVYSFIEGFSMSFRIDGPAMLFAGMISVMWPFVLLYAFEYMAHAARKSMFFAFYVMTYGITLGVAFAHNLVTMYVFFEMLTLVTIPLVGFYEDHESLFAARHYAAYCIGGASLGFFAVVMATLDGGGEFVYGGNLGDVFSDTLMRVVFLFGFFGFGTKAAVFPLHRWLPLAGVAPTPVTALLHAVAVVNSGVYAVMRLAWYAYGPEFLLGSGIQEFCVLIAAFTLVFAAVGALKERHFKRRLAYSTVSNLSYMLFGIMLMTPEGLLAGMAHMLFHGVIKMSLFLRIYQQMASAACGSRLRHSGRRDRRRVPHRCGFSLRDVHADCQRKGLLPYERDRQLSVRYQGGRIVHARADRLLCLPQHSVRCMVGTGHGFYRTYLGWTHVNQLTHFRPASGSDFYSVKGGFHGNCGSGIYSDYRIAVLLYTWYPE